MPKNDRRRKEKGNYIRKWAHTYLMYLSISDLRIFKAFSKASTKNKSNAKAETIKLWEAYAVHNGTYKKPEQLTFADFIKTLPKPRGSK